MSDLRTKQAMDFGGWMMRMHYNHSIKMLSCKRRELISRKEPSITIKKTSISRQHGQSLQDNRTHSKPRYYEDQDQSNLYQTIDNEHFTTNRRSPFVSCTLRSDIDQRRLETIYYSSNRNDEETVKNLNQLAVQLPKSQNKSRIFETTAKKTLVSFKNEEVLQRRAKEFVSLIKKDRSRFKGKLFLLKQQEQARRRLKTQIEECEKIMLKNYYKEQRKSQAKEKIKEFQKRAADREKMSRMSKQKNSLDVSISINKMSRQRINSKKDDSDSKSSSIIVNQSRKTKESRKSTTFESQNYLKNDIYLGDEEDKKMEQARKMLVKLAKMIDKEEKLLRYDF